MNVEAKPIPSALTWRACQVYLVVLALVALVGAAWIFRYWNRQTSYLDKLPRLAAQVPALLRDNVARHGLEGAIEAPALAIWVFGPIALPVGAAACAAVLVGLRRRRRWALVAAIVVALAALVVIRGGIGALHGIEDRHFFARSPYVRTYRALGVPLVVGSIAVVLVTLVDGVVGAYRRRRRVEGG